MWSRMSEHAAFVIVVVIVVVNVVVVCETTTSRRCVCIDSVARCDRQPQWSVNV